MAVYAGPTLQKFDAQRFFLFLKLPICAIKRSKCLHNYKIHIWFMYPEFQKGQNHVVSMQTNVNHEPKKILLNYTHKQGNFLQTYVPIHTPWEEL